MSSIKSNDCSFYTNPTGQELLVSRTEQVIEQFNQHVEEEKMQRDATIKIIQMVAAELEKRAEEDSDKRLTDLHEEMQRKLEAINSNISDIHNEEEGLQKFVHGFQVLSKELGPVISAYKPRLAEDGTEGGEEKLTDQD